MPRSLVRSASRQPTRASGARAGRLRSYQKKRDLKKSGEPAGGKPSTSELLSFVIQKHDATRLHYDLRLEMSGVLKSWAVPKGLPDRPGTRALAIEVEDHPLDYGSFEGVIPPGNYGAGTVMVWDRGVYLAQGGDPEQALREGKLHFALAGKKCTGEWTLVRLKSAADKPQWLLLKNKDKAGRSAIKSRGRDRSAMTGRTLDEIAAQKPAEKK